MILIYLYYTKSFPFFGPWPHRKNPIELINANLFLFTFFQTLGFYFYSLTYSNKRVRNLDEILVTPEKQTLLISLMKNGQNSLILFVGSGIMSFPVLFSSMPDEELEFVQFFLMFYGISIFFIWINTILLVLISRKDLFGRYISKAHLISQVGIWTVLFPYFTGCFLPFIQILVIYVIYLYSVVDFNKAVK